MTDGKQVPRYVATSSAHTEVTPYVGGVDRERLEQDLLALHDEVEELRAANGQLRAAVELAEKWQANYRHALERAEQQLAALRAESDGMRQPRARGGDE